MTVGGPTKGAGTEGGRGQGAEDCCREAVAGRLQALGSQGLGADGGSAGRSEEGQRGREEEG